MTSVFYTRFLESKNAAALAAQRRAAGEASPQKRALDASLNKVDRTLRRQQIYSRPPPVVEITSTAQLRKHAKSAADGDFLRSVLRENFLFKSIKEEIDAATGLPTGPLQHIIDCMSPCPVKAGATVITQGAFDDNMSFYCMQSGSAVATIDGQVKMLYDVGACFGELALIYNAPRAATVQATSDTMLWAIDIKTFKTIMATTEASLVKSKCDFLKKCNFLDALTNELITKLSGAVTEKTFVNGEFIIRQGQWFLDLEAQEAGRPQPLQQRGEPHLQTTEQEFFIILEGTVKCTQVKASGKEVDLITLGEGAHFGEMALLTDEPRRANCFAVGRVRCLCLSRANFQLLLGPIHGVLQKHMRVRILQSVPLFRDHSHDKLAFFSDAMHMEAFIDGQYIIKQGQVGDKFFIIHEGSVKCTQWVEAGRKEVELVRLEANEFFGERALIKDEPRKANVVAVGNVECLVLTKAQFQELDQAALETIGSRGRNYDGDDANATAASSAGMGAVGMTGVAGAAGGSGPRGSVAPKAPSQPEPLTNYRLEELRMKQTLGTGTFGRVRLALSNRDGEVYALKCMKKREVVDRHQDANILSEKNLLFLCSSCPFILKLYQTFQSPGTLYMLMEFVQGGELWSYIYDEKKRHLLPRGPHRGFMPDAVRFYAANVILAFQHMHQHSIAYRDLKPENLLIDNRGYIKVIDFGFAKTIPFVREGRTHEKTFTLCGTPEYLAPEIVLSKGYDKSVDCWALGCLVFELDRKRTPFAADASPNASNNAIFKNIIESQEIMSGEALFPPPCDAACIRLVKKLLTYNPSLRLGNTAGGMEAVMAEPFFEGFDWAELQAGRMAAPFRPTVKHKLDAQNFEQYEEEEGEEAFSGDQAKFLNF